MYCPLLRMLRYSSCITGGYRGGFWAFAHADKHSITAVGSGDTKYGIEHRESAIEGSTSPSLDGGGSVTR